MNCNDLTVLFKKLRSYIHLLTCHATIRTWLKKDNSNLHEISRVATSFRCKMKHFLNCMLFPQWFFWTQLSKLNTFRIVCYIISAYFPTIKWESWSLPLPINNLYRKCLGSKSQIFYRICNYIKLAYSNLVLEALIQNMRIL